MVDVAAAIVAALKDDGSSMGKTYELGGPDVFTTHELVNFYSPSFSLSLWQLSGFDFQVFLAGGDHV